MTSKLDDISFALGEIKADIRELKRRAEEDRDLVEQRHRENSTAIADALKEIRDFDARCMTCLRGDADINAPMPFRLSTMSRGELVKLASIGLAFAIGFGWAVEATIKWLVTVALAHLHWN